MDLISLTSIQPYVHQIMIWWTYLNSQYDSISVNCHLNACLSKRVLLLCDLIILARLIYSSFLWSSFIEHFHMSSFWKVRQIVEWFWNTYDWMPFSDQREGRGKSHGICCQAGVSYLERGVLFWCWQRYQYRLKFFGVCLLNQPFWS